MSGYGSVSIAARASGESLRARLRRGAVLGTFQLAGHPAVTEVLARTGVEVIVPDGEHAPLDIATVEHLVRASELHGAWVVVRAARADAGLSRVLDTGAAGVVIPRVESAQDAADIVRFTRFPPLGARGLGPGRATFYALDAARHRASANDELLVVAMVETRAGLEHLDEIVAVDGIDVIMVGPADLASSLDVPLSSDEHRAAIERIHSAARDAGRLLGIHCADLAEAQRYHAQGVDFLLIGTDLAFLAGAVAPSFPLNPFNEERHHA